MVELKFRLHGCDSRGGKPRWQCNCIYVASRTDILPQYQFGTKCNHQKYNDLSSCTLC